MAANRSFDEQGDHEQDDEERRAMLWDVYDEMTRERDAAFREATERIDGELGRDHEEAFPRSIIAFLATSSMVLGAVFLSRVLGNRWWIALAALALVSLAGSIFFALRGFGIRLTVRRRRSERR